MDKPETEVAGEWARLPDGSWQTLDEAGKLSFRDGALELDVNEWSGDPLPIPVHVIGSLLVQDGWVLMKKEMFEKAVSGEIAQAAKDYVTKMRQRNEEPAGSVSSHRILHLTVEQFNAHIALKNAVELSEVTDEERAGVKMIIYLQSIIGITETPEKALAGWRGMSAQSKETTWAAYRTLKKE